ncbi:exosome complex exonuclease Rrp41 [Candidatus Woesearchaeota archaeon]|nr:MAG: exosome complex exonuclease Rrp41 [Candidatus Woesearchaeota archaeon]
MSYNKRFDGRKFTETRPMKAKTGVVKNAVGSAMFQIGKTRAIAAVYGPRELHPKHLQDPSSGRLRCHYNMMAFSGSGDRVRPGPSRRSKEISYVTELALSPVLDLSAFPKTVVDVFIELVQTDAGTRCAGICAASMALADAGLKMKDLVCAVSVGLVGGTPVVDLNYEEEAYEEGAVDIPIAMTPRDGKFSLLQLDGDLSKEDFEKALALAKDACQKIYEVQKNALKERYVEDKK